jgi:hypothetical protein
MESQNNLRDAVDKHYISEVKRQELDALAETALKEVTGLMEYLQSPEALRNAGRARERRIASRQERRKLPQSSPAAPDGANPESGTPNNQNPEHEPRN